MSQKETSFANHGSNGVKSGGFQKTSFSKNEFPGHGPENEIDFEKWNRSWNRFSKKILNQHRSILFFSDLTL